ncbi:MAG: hypothetical protein OSA98_03910 [Rubripirellula sp.]|nr:hypothetical protein [Rubripirellula sp.]
MRKVALRSFFCLITLLICHDHVLAVGLGVTAASQISRPDGFEAELVDEIPSDQQGPWGSLTVDPKGRLIASDQDGAKQFRTDNGRIVLGRVVKMRGNGLSVMTDILDPSKRQVVQRNPVEVTEPAKVSMMPAGLLDTFTPAEIADLATFLRVGGRESHPIFNKPPPNLGLKQIILFSPSFSPQSELTSHESLLPAFTCVPACYCDQRR